MNLELTPHRNERKTLHGLAQEPPPALPSVVRVYLLQNGEPRADKVETLLRTLADQSGGSLVFHDKLRPAVILASPSGEDLVVAAGVSPGDPLLAEFLNAGAGAIALVPVVELAHWSALAERHPVLLAPPEIDRVGMQAVLAGAVAAVRRDADLRLQLRLLQQRLDDRVLIERAKGTLSRRLGIGEEEAYRRLRTTARRQRRSMREVARALLDAEPLLSSPADGPAREED